MDEYVFYCSNCGEIILKDDLFCENCGMQIDH
ncbi:MAG: zinc ribbon domain-containing protein [Candidatus Hodarchaeales archaeon]